MMGLIKELEMYISNKGLLWSFAIIYHDDNVQNNYILNDIK